MIVSALKRATLAALRKLGNAMGADRLLTLGSMREAMVDMNIAQIKATIAQHSPNAPVLHGYRVYSQCDEDGIIARIFELIGERTRLFVEIGCGNGIENNTHNLLIKGWRGAWIDADRANIAGIQSELDYAPNDVLSVRQAFVDVQNVNDFVKQGLSDVGVQAFPADLDFCSIDIDGNELYVWQALNVVKPRVLCIEYNARFPPPMEVVIGYRADHRYAEDDYQGASLQALTNALQSSGYQLVACGISGVNAFFVQAAELGRLQAGDIGRTYMPPRHYMILSQPGLRASMKYARDRLRAARRV
jgi:hypothetical protein